MSSPPQIEQEPQDAVELETGDIDQSAVTQTRPTRKAEGSPRNRLAVDARRAQLLELGQELFGTYNYDELSIDEIARAAKISKGLLYHYFPSKRDYYMEVMRAGADELLRVTDPPEADTPVQRLELGIDGYLDYVEEHQKPFCSLMRAAIGYDPEICQIIERTRQAFLQRYLEAIGDDRPAMRTAIRGWISFVEGAVRDWLEHRDLSRAELRRLLLDMACQTIQLAKARASGA